MKRILSVFRSENKFIIDLANAISLKNKFDKILKKDSYSKESGYIVRSLYFDSINNIDYKSKLAGLENRKKIRIRLYNLKDKKCKLELKEKKGDVQHKISLWISKSDVNNIIKGNFNVLIKYFDEYSDAIKIYTEMTLGCYRPVVMIEYDRIAYVNDLYNTRITFDMNIRSSESNFNIFDENIKYHNLLNNQCILEVKYNKKLLDFISQTLKPYNLNKISISKYCMGRTIYQNFNY